MDTEIRRLHLNLQTAKTKILSEKDGEISKELIDRRYAQLDDADDFIGKNLDLCSIKDNTKHTEALQKLEKIYNTKPDAHNGGHSVAKSRKPLLGSNDRVFRRLLTMHIKIGSDALLPRLVKEVKFNADQRLGIKLIQYSKTFPRKVIFVNSLFKHFSQENNTFPYQLAQILQAIKYQSRVPEEIIDYCLKISIDPKKDDYLRSQAMYVLSRCQINGTQMELLEQIFESSSNTIVREAAAINLVKIRGSRNSGIISNLVFHPNEEIRLLGKFLRSTKNDVSVANRIMDQATGKLEFLAVEYCSLLYLLCESEKSKIKLNLKNRILSNKLHCRHSNMDMRDHFKKMLEYIGDGQTNSE